MRNRIIRKDQKHRMPVIGKVKVGEKIEKNGKEYPVSLDYFVADGNYKHIFDKKFGEKPKKLDVIFISDDPAECCVERMEIRQGPKLFAKGDGITFEVWDKKTEAYIVRTTEAEPDLIQKIEKQCGSTFEEVLTLYFLVLGINEVFGVWKFSTKGRDSSIPSIVSSFDKVLEMAGRIKFIPFTLSVEKVKSQKPDSKSLFPVVTLVANIGQEYMEKLQNHIMGGVDISGVITEEKINNVIPEIEYKDLVGEDVDFEFYVVPTFKEKIDKCRDPNKLKDIAQEIGSMNLPVKYRDELREEYVKQMQVIVKANEPKKEGPEKPEPKKPESGPENNVSPVQPGVVTPE